MIILAVRLRANPIVVPRFEAGFVVGIRSSREAALGIALLLLSFTFTFLLPTFLRIASPIGVHVELIIRPFPCRWIGLQNGFLACLDGFMLYEHRVSLLPRLDMPRLHVTVRVEARTKVLQDDVSVLWSHLLNILDPELICALRQAGTF